jgi:predicted transcriptional regulator
MVFRYISNYDIQLIGISRLIVSRRKHLQKRSQVTITIDILEATLKPEKKMRIMYHANLNYIRFNRYLSHLLNKGFIEPIKDNEGNGRYCITPRGKKLLLILKKANELGYSDE